MDVWTKGLEHASSDGDVTIAATADAAAESSEEKYVRAHGFMLKAASPVLWAMLEGPLREGEAQLIRVEEPAAAVRQLLSLIYTGSLLLAEQNDTLWQNFWL